MKLPIWSFIPIALLFFGLFIFWFSAWNKPEKLVMVDYGGNGPVAYDRNTGQLTPNNPSCHIIIDGADLDYLSNRKYKLLGVLFHILPGSDRLDVKNMSKSNLFDIRHEKINIAIFWNSTFIKEWTGGAVNIDYTLLALPIGVTPDQFDTLRQAIGLGAKIIEERGGPP
jgi:hypothetical protein